MVLTAAIRPEVVISIAGFLVAALAFYRTTLKGPDIELVYVPQDDEIVVGGWHGFAPASTNHVRPAFYCHNGGAAAGVVERIQLRRIQGLERVIAGNYGFRPHHRKHVSSPSPLGFPLTLQPGEVQTLYIIGRVDLQLEGPQASAGDEEAFATALGAAHHVRVEVSWTYFGRRSPADVLHRRPAGRRTRQRSIPVDPHPLRRYFALNWVSNADASERERGRELARLAGIDPKTWQPAG